MPRLARAGATVRLLRLAPSVSGDQSAPCMLAAHAAPDDRAGEADACSSIGLDQLDAVVMLAGVAPGRDRSRTLVAKNAALASGLCCALSSRPGVHLVHLSSDAVYHDCRETITERSCTDSPSLYGVSHRVREAILGADGDSARDLLVIRSTMLYGDGDTHGAYGPNRFCRQALDERRVQLFGAGEDVRDYLAIEDLVELTVAALARRVVGCVNAASGEPASARDVAETVARATGARVESTPRRQPASVRTFDVTALRQMFPGLVPTPLALGLERLIVGLRARRSPPQPSA